MAHLVAAPDKFRGTASAAEVAAAAARAARAAGWSADELPLADGGEGTVDVLARALRSELRRSLVRGPLGEPVEAEWLFVPGGLGDRLASAPVGIAAVDGPAAVIESALAVGRARLPSPTGDDPVRARTDGVGDLILAALDAGARLVLVGAGGSATTDGGWGALTALRSPERLGGATLAVACDVASPFRSAAETFAPQKGATPGQVTRLRAQLDALAELYRDERGVDVDSLEGAGAGGGLAGGLAALGARLVGGFALVAALVDLDRRIGRADLVMTGEGRLDTSSFAGKVVGGVLAAAGGGPAALCVAGEIEHGVERHWVARRGPVDAVSLASRVGDARALHDTIGVVSDVVGGACARWPAKPAGTGPRTAPR